MEGVGRKLRSRALELGLSDAEVARRAGLTATRYGHYVSDYREPDLATLVRVCRVLGLRPDELLGYRQGGSGEDDGGLADKRRRVAGFVAAMDSATLDLALAVVQALAATAALRGAAEAAPAGYPVRQGNKTRSAKASPGTEPG